MRIKWRIYPFGAVCHRCRCHVFMLDGKEGFCKRCWKELSYIARERRIDKHGLRLKGIENLEDG